MNIFTKSEREKRKIPIFIIMAFDVYNDIHTLTHTHTQTGFNAHKQMFTNGKKKYRKIQFFHYYYYAF